MGKLVESVILDIPALVAEPNGALGGKLGSGRSGYPDPLAAEEFRLTIELPSYGVSFPRTNHAHRGLHLRPGTQIGSIPPFASPTAIEAQAQFRRLLGEQRHRIHIQVTAFLLQHHQCMFAVGQQAQ
jgi:hypothetical protein